MYTVINSVKMPRHLVVVSVWMGVLCRCSMTTLTVSLEVVADILLIVLQK